MDARRTYAAVALAGGALESDFRSAGFDAPNKAYLDVCGQTMLERVLSALRAASAISRIVCVTQPAEFSAAYGRRARQLCDDVIAPGGDLIDSLLAGVGALPADELVIVAATDIPLVTGASIDAFAERLDAAPCDVGYGFVSRLAHEQRFPQVRHTWVRLREGTFCGSGVSALRVGAAAQLAALLRKFALARKSPLRLASLFSPLLMARFAFGAIGIDELEQRAQRLSGLRCRGILCAEPELAVNVDTLADLLVVRSLVATSERGPG